MGLFIFIIFVVGVAIGSALTIALATGSILFVLTVSKSRRHTWPVFAAVAVSACLVFVFLVWVYPYESTQPGSDYEIVAQNGFISALGYCLAPGLALLTAALATLACPRAVAIDTEP